MTYKDVLEKLQTLKPEQLSQPAGLYVTNMEGVEGFTVDDIDITEQDMYRDYYGNHVGCIECVKNKYGDKWEEILPSLIKIPAGMVALVCEQEEEEFENESLN